MAAALGAAVWPKVELPSVRFSPLTLSSLSIARMQGHWGTALTGEATWFLKQEMIEIPTQDCWALVTPYRTDGGTPDDDAQRRVHRAAAVLSGYCGENALRSEIFDGEMDAASGVMHFTSEPTRTPQWADGPSFGEPLMRMVGETFIALRSQPPERRRRLNLALEYLDRGIHEYDDFFSYWTALELVANGKAPTIRARIQSCYGLKTPHDVETSTGFPVLRQWRHDFIHKGIRPSLTSDVARYLQLLFMDLLRQELDLPLGGLIASIHMQDGFDLTPLGLADNRTDQQRAAIAQSVARLASGA